MIYFACILATNSRLRLSSNKMHFNIKKAVVFWAIPGIKTLNNMFILGMAQKTKTIKWAQKEMITMLFSNKASNEQLNYSAQKVSGGREKLTISFGDLPINSFSLTTLGHGDSEKNELYHKAMEHALKAIRKVKDKEEKRRILSLVEEGLNELLR